MDRSRRPSDGALHPLDDGDGSSEELTPPWIERNSVDDSADGVQQMPCGKIPAVTAPVDERFSLTRWQGLHDDLCLVPLRLAVTYRLVTCRFGNREEHGVATGQDLRP